MIKAKHHFLLDPFFRFYVIRKMNHMFQSVKLFGDVANNKQPVLLIGNHVSWWDGIWALNLNHFFFHRKYYFMMLEEQLRKNWFFQYTGGFSIQKKSKSILETFDYTAELLENPENLVLLFPTGKIQSIHKNEFVFEKGMEKILQKLKNKIQVIFMVNLVDYFSNTKPSVYTFFEEYSGKFNTLEMQKGFNDFHKNCVNIQKQKES
ncbi:1-acyl-sn-glycerol-3-phosphate acyltransferase [Maribellus maritimus]|uniref:1-acyl-sn-glycerol-3-phosphate acyltransferase n=1 Tax=Maribellus maritimus TaxID=2870838 RepID=UPI001EEBAB6F|nr:1-acyl-sn-glycerol-3-phosphate acyltransferase [Maribellus maritimus]MCG6189192.1 1-acyl-sn-glycerol-3-phosphate acyltransferase [Maribellus maritimus]